MKLPFSLVVNFRLSLVPALTITTEAFATMPPLASVTLPLSPPRLVWEKAGNAINRASVGNRGRDFTWFIRVYLHSKSEMRLQEKPIKCGFAMGNRFAPMVVGRA